VRPSTQLAAWARSNLVRMDHYVFAWEGKP
jgi:hypothetical protein